MKVSRLPLLCLIPAIASTSAFSTLDRERTAFLKDVLETTSAEQNYCKPSGLIEDACCDFETVETVNNDLHRGLHELVETPYFRYHKVDLYRECPFWQEDGSCMNRACGVETTDEEHIPEPWRSHKLSEVNLGENDSAPARIDDKAFCVVQDEDDHEGLYVDLIANPERFTGYAGHSSSRVWKAIYEENCFTPVPFIDPARGTAEGGSGFAPISLSSAAVFGSLPSGGPAWGESEKRLFGSLAGPRDGGDEVCLEKRVFYRLISGLHASISIHICDEYLDQATGEWSPNLECFVTRIGQHPERLQNLYFTYVVALRALSRAGPQLISALEETSADGGAGGRAKERLQDLVDLATGCPSTFDETSMFSGPSAEILKSEFKEHFRNVSRIMDCVGCDKCRLWGKLQVTGLGTALKLLFSYDVPDGTTPAPIGTGTESLLSRGELVSFVNVLHRLSESLQAVDRFRELWAKRELQGVPVVESASASASSSVSSVSASEATESAAMPKRKENKKEKQREPSKIQAVKDTGELGEIKAALSDGEGEQNRASPPKPCCSKPAVSKRIWHQLGEMCGGGWRSCYDVLKTVAFGGLPKASDETVSPMLAPTADEL